MRKKVIFTLLLVCLAFILASCHVRYPSDIRPGMTKEDVTRAWGGTYLITHQMREGKQVEVWDYHFANTGAVCRIVFYQDKVTTTQCWRRAPRPWWY
jgi:hypothetical protein